MKIVITMKIQFDMQMAFRPACSTAKDDYVRFALEMPFICVDKP